MSLKSRKLLFAFAVFVTATAFRVFDLIGEETWMQTVVVIVSAYSAANVGAKFAVKGEKRPE